MRQPASLGDICVKYIAGKLTSIYGRNNITLPDELYIKILQHLRNQGLLSTSTLASFLIPKIHSINFTSCVQINDQCIETIAKICPGIQNLVLSKCPMITDHGIQVIAHACLGLKLLHISKCYQITDKAFADPCILALLDDVCTKDTENKPKTKPFSNLIELDVSGTKITDETIVFISDCCTELKLLDVSDCNITIKSINVVEEKLSGLKVLRVSGCHMDYGSSFTRLKKLETLVARQCPLMGDNTIVDLINSSPSLSSLDLQWSGITDTTIEELRKISTKLVTLRLSWCSLVGESALGDLLKTCANLQTLDVSWRSMHDDTLRTISENCTNLKLLDISGCNELSAKSLGTCGGDTLEFLSLSWCRGLTDEALGKIINRSLNLKTIDISLCNSISPSMLSELGKCKKLQAIMAFKCPQLTDAGFLDLFRILQELTIVNLSECHITDAAIIELAHTANRLRILAFAGCKAISSKALLALAQNCLCLESLNASSTNVDDEGIEALVSNCGGLVSLTLIGCKQITDKSVLAIAQKSRVLQNILLSYCPTITEEALVQLAKKCTYLQIVELSNCAGAVTDTVICELAMHASLLQILNVSGCQNITDSSIDYLWLYGQQLTSIDVSRCPSITSPALESFSALLPHVTIKKNGI
eukprot:Phypoly_transcript_02001.p1 GENE.Phypoly_transcript_02001~~Phypoly_transcript_02001.p1  ORF type:complete len:648 (-),score=51.44 Phypoly_transcript_02001:294-2237(-)